MVEEYNTKSAIIGKAGKANENEDYPVFVNLFDKNDPHKDPEVLPVKFLNYEEIHKIIIKGLELNYLLVGSDIVINNLKKIRITVEGPHLIISGVQG